MESFSPTRAFTDAALSTAGRATAAGRFAAVSVQMQPSLAFGNPVEAQTTAFTQRYRLGDVRNYDITPAGKFVALVDPREPGVS
jgi:hypothetical protein